MHESDYNIQAISHLRKMINDAEMPKTNNESINVFCRLLSKYFAENSYFTYDASTSCANFVA